MSEPLDDHFDHRRRADRNTAEYTIGPRGFMGPRGAGRGTPKPLHWTRIRLVATVLGMVLASVVLAIVAGTAFALVGVPLGAIVGLLVVTAMERAGVFRRTDEL